MSKAKPITKSTDFNLDWLFLLADPAKAFSLEHDDSRWRKLNVPHDWSVEHTFDNEKGNGATAYLPGGIGWYRKHFELNPQDDELVFALFDGIYNNAELWLNGKKLGENPYGYSPFWFELTPHLKPAQEQLLAVRVDHSRYIDSRWYTGSGIYRNVKLIRKNRLHIPIWGTRITTPKVSSSSAQIDLEVRINNAFKEARAGTLKTVFLNAKDQELASVESHFKLEPEQELSLEQSVTLVKPDLWHPDQPHRYKAVTTLESEGTLCDLYETPFGIRSIRFDPNEGFFLNNENTLIKGVCLHHDAGLVGAAVPDGVWRRRFKVLKELGCNAIRTAHNPFSEAFLDLCDDMGFLVQEEFFDEWDNPKDKRLNKADRHGDEVSNGYAAKFQDWAESDLKRTLQRDWNHPCIFQWSIGNEIEWTYPRYEQATGYFDAEATGNYFWTLPPYSASEIKERFDALPEERYVLAKTAHKLATWTRELDTTRPVTANCILPSASHVSGYADALDIVGYSYRQVMYDRGHETYPDKVIMGAENLGQWHEWKHVIERPFISGLFFWTGISYLGEAHKKWPTKGTASGLIDFAGFKRGSFYMMQTLWRNKPQVHLTSQVIDKSPYKVSSSGQIVEKVPGAWKQSIWFWHDINQHWNYETTAKTVVEVYANCEEVELFLNERSLGQQYLKDQEDRIFKWFVPFEAGTLKARAKHSSGETTSTTLRTAGKAAAIQLSSDTASLNTNHYDVAHLVAQIIDDKGVAIKHGEQELVFSVTGVGKVLGVDNGAIDSVQPYQSNRVVTSQGRALLIVQAKNLAGKINVSVSAGSLLSERIEITVSD